MVAFSSSGATLFAAKSIKVLIYKKLSESIEKEKGASETAPGGITSPAVNEASKRFFRGSGCVE